MSDSKKEQSDLNNVLSATIVLIEWGGKKPSTTFYNRLHDYGLRSRVENYAEQTLLEARANFHGKKKRDESRGMIFQEGAIIVNNLSLARTIAQLAKQNGAVAVHVGNVTTMDFKMSEKDYKAFEALQSAQSKRGPKVAIETGKYSVTCFDEADTYVVDDTSLPMMCPNCGSSNIQARMGQRKKFNTPKAEFHGVDGLFDWWGRTRFAKGTFEIPIDVLDNQVQFPSPQMSAVHDFKIPKFGNLAGMSLQTTINEGLHLFDVCYCLSKMNEVDKQSKRILILNAYIMNGGEDFFSMASEKDKVDIIDLAIVDNRYSKYLTVNKKGR
jgi:Zn finger protein HypA/HybF involved in hydrogenase expression